MEVCGTKDYEVCGGLQEWIMENGSTVIGVDDGCEPLRSEITLQDILEAAEELRKL